MEDERDGEEDRRLASRRVADELKAAIESGAYPVGTALPPLRQLAEEHRVAVNTAMAAVRLLGDEGYVTNRPNAGSYVRDWTSVASPEQELRRLRVDLGDLRSQLRRFDESLAAMDARLSGLSELIARSEDREQHPGM